MTLGRVRTSVLTDIANAIRYKSGTSALLRPQDMAAAVLALDGTDAGDYVAQPYKELAQGVISDSVFSGIADAIRRQSGSYDVYEPGEMAQAILDLEFDFGYKCRALLLEDGILEINYLDRRRVVQGDTGIVECWEIDPDGYASAAARPWHDRRASVRAVLIDSSYMEQGPANCDYFFNGMSNMTYLFGFECLRNMTSAVQMFSGCTKLNSLYARPTWQNNISSGSMMFYGCPSLVGGADGFVPSNTSGPGVCKIGAGGVLTETDADTREYFYAHFYADGGAVLNTSIRPESGRAQLAWRQIYAGAHYNALGFAPWDSSNRSQLTSVTFDASLGSLSDLRLDMLFYNCSNLATVAGLGNLGNVSSMRYTFSGIAATSLDFRGFDPSGLTDLFYCFSGSASLATIYADPSWALPASGISGSSCFYNCKALVGGNGTAWASNKTAYTYFRIDTASTPGYLTAA